MVTALPGMRAGIGGKTFSLSGVEKENAEKLFFVSRDQASEQTQVHAVKWTKLKRGQDSCHDGTSEDCSAMAAGWCRCAGNAGAGGGVELQAPGSSVAIGPPR